MTVTVQAYKTFQLNEFDKYTFEDMEEFSIWMDMVTIATKYVMVKVNDGSSNNMLISYKGLKEITLTHERTYWSAIVHYNNPELFFELKFTYTESQESIISFLKMSLPNVPIHLIQGDSSSVLN